MPGFSKVLGESDQRGGGNGGFLRGLPGYKARSSPVTLQTSSVSALLDYSPHPATAAVGPICFSLVDLKCKTELNRFHFMTFKYYKFAFSLQLKALFVSRQVVIFFLKHLGWDSQFGVTFVCVLWPPANVRTAPDKHPLAVPESSPPLSHGLHFGFGGSEAAAAAVLVGVVLSDCALRHPRDSRRTWGEPSPPPTQGQRLHLQLCVSHERFKAVPMWQRRVSMGEF